MKSPYAKGLYPLLTAVALALPPARAAETGWRVQAGPGVVLTPEYPGADDYEVLPIPAIDIAYGRTFFIDTRRGIGAWMVNEETRQIGASVWFRRGREADDFEPIAGFGEIDDSAVARLLVGQNIGPVALNLTVAQALTDNTGLTVDANAAWRFRISNVTFASLGVQGSWGDDTYMRKWFGAGGGVRSAGAFASVSRAISEAWTVSAFAAYDVLVGDAADSPIVERDGMPTIALSAL